MSVRKATVKDVQIIHKLLNHFAGQSLLLPRSLSELYDHLRDYFVFDPDEPGLEIQGVCGLGICWEDLAEIRSLAVSEDHAGRGAAKQLVDKCLEEAAALKLKRVFVLTYVPAFFSNLGFAEVDKAVLPHKVWADCLKCPKFPDCDETALMIDL